MIKNFIFLGAPGVGKGTMAKELAAEKGMKHISTGDIFRRNIKEQTELGIKVKTILDAGEYVPDDLTNEIVKDTLQQPEVKAAGFILDGYPRTLNQAEFLKAEGIDITAAVLLDASDEMVMGRLLSRAEKENRADDTPEIIANRLRVYNEKTAPLIDWYTNENLLVKVPAEGTVAENKVALIEGLY